VLTLHRGSKCLQCHTVQHRIELEGSIQYHTVIQ